MGLRRRKAAAAAAAAAALALALAGCGGAAQQTASTGDPVEDSKMTVSVSSQLKLRGDGSVGVGFENPGLNGWSQRMEIEQGGRLAYASEVLAAGQSLDTVAADPALEPGEATVTVYAVDPATGEDHGTPVSVEVAVVEAG